MTASLIGCFAGITNDYFAAGLAGMSTMSLAGEFVPNSFSQMRERVHIVQELLIKSH